MGIWRYIGLFVLVVAIIGIFAITSTQIGMESFFSDLLGKNGLLLAPTGTVTIENLYPTGNIDVPKGATYLSVLKVSCSGGVCEDVEVALEYPPQWNSVPLNGDFETGDATAWTFTPPRHLASVANPGEEGPFNFSVQAVAFQGNQERSELWQTFDPVAVDGLRVYHNGDLPPSGEFYLEVFDESSQNWIVVESLGDIGDVEFPAWTEININLALQGINQVSGIRLSGFRNGFCNGGECTASFYTDKICLTENGNCVSPPRELVSDIPGDVPFYTLQNNPQTTFLTDGEETLVLFDVNATGNIGETRTFLGRASNLLGLDESNRWDATIIDAPIEEEEETCHVFLDTQGQTFTLSQDLQFDETCLIVAADDVTVDGAGFSINTNVGESDPEDVGIYIQGNNAYLTNADINNFGRAVNVNNQRIEFCSIVSNASDGARVYYENDASPIDAALLIDVTYVANYAGGDASNRIFVGDGFLPYGRGTASVPLTQNGNAIIDNNPGFGVPGLHIMRGQDGIGKYFDIVGYGLNGVNVRESMKFRTFLMNANIESLDPNGAFVGGYEKPFEEGCGIVAEDGDPSDDIPTNDEIVIISGNDDSLIENSVFTGNTERAVDVRGSNHILRNLSIVNSGNAIALDDGGNNLIENNIVSGTTNLDIMLLTDLVGRNYIVDSVLQGYQFLGNSLLTLRTTNVGEIEFLQPLSGVGTSLANDIVIQNNLVEVNDAQQGLNRTANITLWNVPIFTNPEILRNGAVCDVSMCTAYTPLNVDPVRFGVSSWTEYSIGEDAVSFDLVLSPSLASSITWNVAGWGNNQHATGNNGNVGSTLYWVDISSTGTNVDLYIKADGDLISGAGDILGLGNETYKKHLTNPTVPGLIETPITTNWALVDGNLPDGQRVYFKFLLDVPQGTRAGIYSNNVQFVIVRVGDSPP